MSDIHPDFKRMATLEELADALANNASIAAPFTREAFKKDAMDCLLRAIQIADGPYGEDGPWAAGWKERCNG